MCLPATITPLSLITSPFGPIIFIPGVPSNFPDSLTGGFTPSLKLSLIDISTCVSFLTGPRTLTPSNLPFGPTIVTFSSAAYCPGCFISFILVKV